MKKNKKSPGNQSDDRERNDALNKSSENERAKGENKLPGEYPPQEDMMNRRDTERIRLDVDNFSRQLGHENLNKAQEPVITDPAVIQDAPDLGPNVRDDSKREDMQHPVPKDLNLDEDDMEFATGNESDVTKEDLEALGSKDLSLDMGDDENILKNRVWPVDMAGEDLDVPGSELDDESEAVGSEDEENNSYSLGGDRLEDSLEGK